MLVFFKRKQTKAKKKANEHFFYKIERKRKQTKAKKKANEQSPAYTVEIPPTSKSGNGE
ncbi:hypothetical protein [Nitritalea halalkaliphila]|uniref:hypothetical protein n=1 Tax=Nitritalea halalkaliphila TaxID=590849 RepID=UPI0012EA6589|nr:hypothetical protein [Nitritalea halalkaliphila]